MTFSWGVVHTVSPLTVKKDGSSNALPVIQSLVDPSSLTVGDMVRVELAQGGRVVVHGRTDGLGVLTGENLIINGDFRVNQRDAVSGATVGSGAYFLDRWFNASGGSTGSISFYGRENLVTVAITASTALRVISQIIERVNAPGGDYVLSWEGTAGGRVYQDGTTPPPFSLDPMVFASDGSGNLVVEFSNLPAEAPVTVTNVKLERGTVPTPFVPRLYGDELALCQRYYIRFNGGGLLTVAAWRSTDFWGVLALPGFMRANPTLSHSGLSDFSIFTEGTTLDPSSVVLGSSSTFYQEVRLNVVGATQGASGWVRLYGWLAFDAEL